MSTNQIRCSYCGSDKHTVIHCPKTWDGQGNRNTLHCGYCGSNKHNTDGCPKCWPGPNPIVIEY